MAKRATKSKKNPPSRRAKKVKKGLKKPSGGTRSKKIDPRPGPRRELIAPAPATPEDPLPGGDPFDL
jgi:hypothetical protein